MAFGEVPDVGRYFAEWVEDLELLRQKGLVSATVRETSHTRLSHMLSKRQTIHESNHKRIL
jgi:hypothetical protein